MHILVYMYVFIYCKLESFFILMRFTYIKKTGRHGFNGEQSGERNVKSNHFRKAFLTSCKAGGCSMDINSFIFVLSERGPCGH